MNKAKILYFSPNRDSLEDHIASIREILDKKGAGYEGPMSYSPVDYTVSECEIQLIPVDDQEKEISPWIESLQFRDGEIERISQEVLESTDTVAEGSLFYRQIRIFSERILQRITSIHPPKDVFLRIIINPSSVVRNRHSPHTYDVGKDYVTDVDYDAHHQ